MAVMGEAANQKMTALGGGVNHKKLGSKVMHESLLFQERIVEE